MYIYFFNFLHFYRIKIFKLINFYIIKIFKLNIKTRTLEKILEELCIIEDCYYSLLLIQKSQNLKPDDKFINKLLNKSNTWKKKQTKDFMLKTLIENLNNTNFFYEETSTMSNAELFCYSFYEKQASYWFFVKFNSILSILSNLVTWKIYSK